MRKPSGRGSRLTRARRRAELARFWREIRLYALDMERRTELRHWHPDRRKGAKGQPASGPASPSDRRMTQALLQLASTPHGDWSSSIRQVLQFDAEMLHVERVSFWSL